jgi:hypothetical protein
MAPNTSTSLKNNNNNDDNKNNNNNTSNVYLCVIENKKLERKFG